MRVESPRGRITQHFSWKEARDKTGRPFHDPRVLKAIEATAYALEVVRGRVQGPLVLNSWYRHPEHPDEAGKDHPGAHTAGKAVDVRVYDQKHAHAILRAAVLAGFHGFGVKMRGPWDERFLHIDWWEGAPDSPRPGIWSYR